MPPRDLDRAVIKLRRLPVINFTPANSPELERGALLVVEGLVSTTAPTLIEALQGEEKSWQMEKRQL